MTIQDLINELPRGTEIRTTVEVNTFYPAGKQSVVYWVITRESDKSGSATHSDESLSDAIRRMSKRYAVATEAAYAPSPPSSVPASGFTMKGG